MTYPCRSSNSIVLPAACLETPAAPEFGRGRAVADRLEDEAVQGAHVRVALPGEFGVQVVDQHTERLDEEKGQVEARLRARPAWLA